MFYDFFRVDKSPIVALTKSGSKKAISLSVLAMTSLSFSIGVVPINIAGVTNQQPATALSLGDYDTAVRILRDLPVAYRKLSDGQIRQYYFASYDAGYIQRQYGASADSVLNRWCANTYSDIVFRGRKYSPEYWSFWGNGRHFLVVSRFEGSRGNCYNRAF